MTESEFIRSIDCQLPYGNLEKVRSLIEQANGISSNAVFMVLHEICRPPRREVIDLNARLELLANWSQSVEHPLSATLLPIAKSMIRGEDVPPGAAVAAMREVAQFPNQYNALAIPYFSCNDVDGEVDALHKRITNAWAGA
jgi:hypothetical protein